TLGLIDIPPFDDPYIIAGQGTVGVEILRQTPSRHLRAVFVCVGGGGLIAGVASYIKRVAPHVKVVGVETYDADAMTRSLRAGHRVTLPEVGLFADGAAVKLVGEETFRLVRDNVDGMVLVSTDEVCAAIRDVFEDCRSVVEPAGALGVAGAKKWIEEMRKRGEIDENDTEGTYVCVTSGANMNFDRLRFVAERAELGEGREGILAVEIPEKPGSFLNLYLSVYPRSVTSFSYRYTSPECARVLLSFNLSGPGDLQRVMADLEGKGLKCWDCSGDEVVKGHARYMVGGRVEVPNERLFRFSFPERPGALHRFLTTLSPSWNLSLFHYRNYGSDVGKVMCGLQVPKEDNKELEIWLVELGYPWVEETGGVAVKMFLGGGGSE
ncbi:hypothetical protein HDU93_001223, partial [Gonapodya sp. JEL0774]